MATLEKKIRMRKIASNGDTVICYPQSIDENILVDGKTKTLKEKLANFSTDAMPKTGGVFSGQIKAYTPTTATSKVSQIRNTTICTKSEFAALNAANFSEGELIAVTQN